MWLKAMVITNRPFLSIGVPLAVLLALLFSIVVNNTHIDVCDACNVCNGNQYIIICNNL